MSSLEQQQPTQTRPTLQLAADAGAGAAAETAMSGCSPVTSPLCSSGGVGFLPDMPQWKKDLIQRRKTNVARTNAAAACSPTSADGNCLTFTEPGDSGATDANATATITTSQQQQLQQQQMYVKRNVSQTQQQQQHHQQLATLKTSPTEEKSEKCFIGAGGHHTLPAVSAATAQSTQGKDLATTAFSAETPAAVTATTTTTSAAAATTAGNAPIPKQRSSLFNTRSQSTGKEQQEILNLDARERERERERKFGERDVNMDVKVNSKHNRSRSRAAYGEVGTGTASTTGALTALGSSGGGSSSSAAATSSSSANQLQTKCKLGQSGAEAVATTVILPLNFNNTPILIDKNCKLKISDKLQSNKFIINQQQQQQQQQQLAASPTKVAVKTTMVAMQEMKKTTQNGQHRLHHHHHTHNHNQHVKTAENEVDVDVGVAAKDNSEDLSYGPGIVSKLRCRYLSLALRCETGQHCQKQRLQRSTSLNTLLDRNDDDEELNSASGVTTPTVAPAVSVGIGSVQRSAAAPPVLGVKPTSILTTGSGYNKSNSAVQQQHQQLLQQQEQPINGTTMRSRHFKRGNEVMKRARSVEALLCEKSPWNTQRASYQAAAVQSSAATGPCAVTASVAAASASPTCVTIEDKINNARERLHSGTDAAPPKRLTSIIDDTERPPPDLVKQTLKMFEASANRRPRAAHRTNGVGGVASKVANYKSIIKDHKPNHKRNEPVPVPVPLPVQGFAASTPKQRPIHSHSLAAVPDIIPRQLDTNSTFDSPVSQLGKILGRMQLEPAAQPQTDSAGGYGGVVIMSNNQRLVSEQRTKAGNDHNNDDDEDEDGNEGNADDVAENEAANAAVDANDDKGADVEVNVNIDDVCNGDNMGAAGNKSTQAALSFDEATATTTATAIAGGQRSFVAALHENAHVNSSVSSSISSRKLTQRNSDNNDYGPSTTTTITKQIGVIRPLLNSSNQTAGSGSGSGTPLTTREIEKNRINEMKKSTALAAAASAGSPTTSLDTVINTKDNSETDAASSASSSIANSGISPVWPLRKRRQPTSGNSNASCGLGSGLGSSNMDNTSMVFNFSKSTKEVPDYIESDVVIYRRKRELPKPNEPGFVLLGDLSVETSTDTDYDDYSMCPPSPCDVEFENANIVIDGKSSIRKKPKDSSFRVQFNDTLTSTFEYPSEASQTTDDPPYADPYGNANKHHQLLYEEQLMLQHHQQQQQQQHHHVTVDEIIELPTSTASSATVSHKSSATSAMLGNLPLGSTALGFYTPVKASPMDSLFQLGVTRYTTPDSGSSGGSSNNSSNNSSNGSSSSGNGGTFNGNGSIVGLGEGLIDDDDNCGRDVDAAAAETIKELDECLTATPAGGIVYSEGTQKTDLLY